MVGPIYWPNRDRACRVIDAFCFLVCAPSIAWLSRFLSRALLCARWERASDYLASLQPGAVRPRGDAPPRSGATLYLPGHLLRGMKEP